MRYLILLSLLLTSCSVQKTYTQNQLYTMQFNCINKLKEEQLVQKSLALKLELLTKENRKAVIYHIIMSETFQCMQEKMDEDNSY